MELAFETTLQSLREEEDMEDGLGYTDYRTVMRLDRAIKKPLGIKYAKIARRCLYCDFGIGKYDLMSQELQEVFYEDVVKGLGALELTLKALD